MLKLVTDSFTQAVTLFAASVDASVETDVSKSNEACRTYAIGYLSGMTKSQINEQAAKIGFTAGGRVKDTQWSVAKVLLSRAHRAIAGEHGFGEKLARMWASGDFSITLLKAYAASAGPRKDVDKVAQAVKLLCNMSQDERNEVTRKVAEAVENYNVWAETAGDRFAELERDAA